MSLASISIKRPVLAIVMSLAIVLFGVISFRLLGVREYPAIDPPIISVRANYAGANASVIESQITEPLEKALNGIQGVRIISSSSSQGSSNITVEFNLDANLEAAANDVRDKVSGAARSLPQDIDAPPVVTKADASSDAIIAVTVQRLCRKRHRPKPADDSRCEFHANHGTEAVCDAPVDGSCKACGVRTDAS
jgi:multidrug efflux pump